MQLDPEYLRQHYASLSDAGLLAIDRADLVETAQRIYDLEVSRRKLAPRQPDPVYETEEDEAEVGSETYGDGEEPDWLEDAAELTSYCVPSSTAPPPDSAVDARDVLEAAGIPYYFDLCEVPPEKSLLPYGTHRWRLMVPGKLNLRAAGVLEREITNTEFEAGWKTHLEALSDEELRAITPKVVFCGLFDRIARVNRVYDEEIVRRKLK
jgi:hypothetical protein